MSGAASRHQKLKWARYSAVGHAAVADLEHVGVVPVAGPGVGLEPDLQVEDLDDAEPAVAPSCTSQMSWMSPVVRHRLPMAWAQGQGLVLPHSQMLKTIGRPLALRASRIRE